MKIGLAKMVLRLVQKSLKIGICHTTAQHLSSRISMEKITAWTEEMVQSQSISTSKNGDFQTDLEKLIMRKK